MNTILEKRITMVTLAICAIFPAQLLASQLTVNTTSDPDVVVSSNCTTAWQDCSLREALAAADETSEHDTIVFEVDGPIYLTRKLTANTSVTIDGYKDTVVRVHQGYNVVTLPDKYSEDNVPVLQPTYQSIGAGRRYMLELSGHGSVVKNLILDGSITPNDGEGLVERIDFNSDGVTDFVLHTIDDEGEDRWLVGGGISADFVAAIPVDCESNPPLGTITINGNQLKNFSDNAISIAFHYNAVITDNEISGGGYGLPGANSDGISMYCGAGALVSENTVRQYRNGISLSFTTAATISMNESELNRTGVEMEFANSALAPNLIEDNIMTNNLEHGILANYVSGVSITGNNVQENGTDPNFHGGILMTNSAENLLDMNDSSENSGFGIVIDSSFLNVLTNNKTKQNGGGGIILVNGAQGNIVEFNTTKLNQAGIISTITYPGAAFPSNNLFENNLIHNNSELDVLDQDPACNDVWTDNEFKSAFSASAGCIN